MKYRLSEIYRQYGIANIGSFLGLVAAPYKVAEGSNEILGGLFP